MAKLKTTQTTNYIEEIMKNNNWNKHKGGFNKHKNRNNPHEKKEEFRGASVYVRGDDVNGALRRLKKILENDNRQKELAKREYYEKPSAKKKRMKDSAKKRYQRDQRKMLATGDAPVQISSDISFMKSKRKRRKHSDMLNAVATRLRKSGHR